MQCAHIVLSTRLAVLHDNMTQYKLHAYKALMGYMGRLTGYLRGYSADTGHWDHVSLSLPVFLSIPHTFCF